MIKKKQIDIIDGVKGEWRNVTNQGDVTLGQRVRMEYKGLKIGHSGLPVFPDDSCERYAVNREFLFNNGYTNIQAFFPLKPKRTRPRKSRDRRLLEALLKGCDVELQNLSEKALLHCGRRFYSITDAQEAQLIAFKQAMDKKGGK